MFGTFGMDGIACGGVEGPDIGPGAGADGFDGAPQAGPVDGAGCGGVTAPEPQIGAVG
jgi:hypothetical protein